MKKFITKWYPLFLILIPAFYLRLHLIINRGTFWFDENFSIHFSTLSSWSETIKYWVLETNPPLHMLLLRFYLPFINQNNEILVRFPSLIFSIGSIILLYIFAQKILSRRVAIVSSILLSISTLNLIISAEARMYSLLTFLSILSFYIFHKLVFEEIADNNKNKKFWILYFFINLFVLYTHLTGVVVILCQFITIVALKPKREIFLNWFKTNILATIIFMIWFIPSIYNKFNLNLGKAWYFETTGDILNLLFSPIANTIITGFLETLFFIIFILISYLLIKEVKEKQGKDRALVILIFLWALTPPLLSSFLSVYVLKYITIAYPALYLFYAYFLDKYVKSTKVFVAIFIMIIFLSLPHVYELITKINFSWSDLTQYIEENEDEQSITIISFMEVLSFNKYYHGNRPVIGLYTYKDDLSLEERIVRYNWNLLEIEDNELNEWLFTSIEKECATKIFLIHPPNSFERIDNALLENNWILDEIKEPTSLSFDSLYIFHAPNNYTTSSTCK
ncbi:MAG: hypothetical protein A2725_02255 [Candidatus Magasanikbacteria bacterium RIFCSPHIGHO2_01_FULL_33_34]|uniref:Glycosyltransferase RgtA/B/C/D-like domain-containing protein n=1 Tax=Candidatus Magasanikbacteria bacterium RIFCSPHIGHO2_01_FULL_33_34 TaxID=1798671 RepID=A0A1F6LKC5_9BACT|nr:MAG: hypothetical protein A2725_02255 [Candidatus Magasanikbacteria bacterium RIFCSPHIGHO2_01_FULL_33_34]OGH65654.1 MAG: hypothetical protein A3B83_02145 [Candidatus Magasanikbacteria bacterium RIFCSPHIGHO2_02_FULL_33_17]OGH75863.1 MAG: hypothetical protein A3A89_03040 [Candidatus Magasanikbacteria bacterium RIFCSPLOWO2_01_FULL_33_34]OGH81839.1 MAG: hypothetical protein A3F93_00240 [Candidatus Magasanikbacteria bacterium RIFCSPLOWO2_12_FULL_34_7]